MSGPEPPHSGIWKLTNQRKEANMQLKAGLLAPWNLKPKFRIYLTFDEIKGGRRVNEATNVEQKDM